jgi:hypothetical protein
MTTPACPSFQIVSHHLAPFHHKFDSLKLRYVFYANNVASACGQISDFITHVMSQSGEKLTVAQASQLISQANAKWLPHADE